MTDNTSYMPEKIDLAGTSPRDERIAQLRQLYPEVFTDGKIDFDALRLSLGDEVETAPREERFGLHWPGKSKLQQIINQPSVGTLVPQPEESVDWDTTQNLIIEGDNLEVLKLLQKSYAGKVKMIYIDPPYNTGSDFIYQDNFSEPTKYYLMNSGQVDASGYSLEGNVESDGRFHATWLTMIHPRLFMARNLLRRDGAIFVSIDDYEFRNLMLTMIEVFGEENHAATFVRKRRMSSGMAESKLSVDHEYVVMFARSIDDLVVSGTPISVDDYPFRDEIGIYRSNDLTVGMNRDMRPNQYYRIRKPGGETDYLPPSRRVWRFEPTRMAEEIASGNIVWPEDDKKSMMKRPR